MNIVRNAANRRKKMLSHTSKGMSLPSHSKDIASKNKNIRKLFPTLFSRNPSSSVSSFYSYGSMAWNISDSVSWH